MFHRARSSDKQYRVAEEKINAGTCEPSGNGELPSEDIMLQRARSSDEHYRRAEKEIIAGISG